MTHQMTRIGLYLERWGTAFAMGLFFVLPLHFKHLGWDETFFGQVYAVGALGTILSVASGAYLIRRFGFSKIAPIGSLLFTVGCLFYLLFDISHSVGGYYLASFFQGAGWGLTFTVGPIGITSTLEDKDDTKRSYYFMMHAAYTAFGAGSAPFVIRYFTAYFHWTSQNLFILATLSSAIAFLIAATIARHNSAYQGIEVEKVSGLSELRIILQQPCIYFFAMMFFGACIYTAIINLQMTFAALKRIDYIVFYGFYSVTIIAARFIGSRPFSKIAPQKSIPYLVLMLVVGIICLFLAPYSTICYATGASLLGIGYGLVYPVVPAEAGRYVPAKLRAPVLVYFSLSYFIGVYLFPFFAALIATMHSYEALWFTLVIVGLIYCATALYFYHIKLKKMA